MLKSEGLNIICKKIADCRLCTELVELRDQFEYLTVPGEGNPNAPLMILGEAPGEDEAKSGRPFVGRAGKLLDNIIQAAGWNRADVYICNILKCRPPKNRVPTSEEASNCRKFLDMQIKLVNPQWILCLGKTATTYLLGITEEKTMGQLRGTHTFQGRNVIATYHPSYLLRTPSAKSDVWGDIQPIISALQSKNTT